MTFTNDTVVQECHDDVTSIPVTQYSFVGIDKIAHIEKDTAIGKISEMFREKYCYNCHFQMLLVSAKVHLIW